MSSGTLKLAVLASGAGTNLQVLLDRVHGRDGIEIVAVASDKPGAPALERAAAAGVAYEAFSRGAFKDREARDVAMGDWLLDRGARLIVLAGYMQLLSPMFLSRFPAAVINVHPALLPAFPGLDAVGQALHYGVKVFGVTVHFVDDGVDTGAVILQRAVELPDVRSADQVFETLHDLEYQLLPEAVRLFAAGALTLDPDNPRRVIVQR
jgi:phosphoribosylglycinamide formyltransferase-1